MAYERICVTCGKQYRYCKNCSEFSHLPTWMYAYCSEPCKDTYMVLNKYDFKHITAEEAQEELERLGVNVANPEMIKSMEAIKREIKVNKKKKKKEERYREWIPDVVESESFVDNTEVNEEFENHNEQSDIVNLID